MIKLNEAMEILLKSTYIPDTNTVAEIKEILKPFTIDTFGNIDLVKVDYNTKSYLFLILNDFKSTSRCIENISLMELTKWKLESETVIGVLELINIGMKHGERFITETYFEKPYIKVLLNK
jgi:hypothetical protein